MNGYVIITLTARNFKMMLPCIVSTSVIREGMLTLIFRGPRLFNERFTQYKGT